MQKESIKIDNKKKKLSAKLKAVTFQEGETSIVYLPSMRISGYGDTLEEAFQLAKHSFRDFCDNFFLEPEHKRFAILRDLGWVRDKIFEKRMRNLSETTFDDIKREFNIPDNTPIRETELTV